MQGSSRFKQAKLDGALQSFFGVLDLKLAGADADANAKGDEETLAGLSRAERELVEDTFRVMSVSLANLQGPASIPAYITSAERRGYEFRVYQQLGELYIIRTASRTRPTPSSPSRAARRCTPRRRGFKRG